jgi:hypothetical protein
MKLFITSIYVLLVLNITAQNNQLPIGNSAITGIQLPVGSKQDKRSLYVNGAKLLLGLPKKINGASIGITEVFYLPASYTIDSLKIALQQSNWTVSNVEGETNYLMLTKSIKQVIAYFLPRKKSRDLYFGEVEQTGVTNATKKDTVQIANTKTNETQTTVPVDKPLQSATGFTFSTTNFDDGWVSTVKDDWVEVTKGNIKVLLHYPNKKADAYNSVLKDGDYNAWNILVAPRYSNLKNFEWKSIQSWESISFMQADAIENGTGKSVHIVLFKKHYSNGNGRYIEFVSDSKATFENEFGPYHNTEFEWDKTANMQFRNKFSVAPNDLIGKWSTTDYASISYYYVNTGGLAGTTATSTADEFTFLPDNNYESDHSGASGMVGNMKFSRQVYKGKSTVTNWNITLTNRFQGDTEKYDSYFEAVKGGRALILKNRLNTVFTLVKQS